MRLRLCPDGIETSLVVVVVRSITSESSRLAEVEIEEMKSRHPPSPLFAHRHFHLPVFPGSFAFNSVRYFSLFSRLGDLSELISPHQGRLQ